MIIGTFFGCLVGVLTTRALLFATSIGAPDCWNSHIEIRKML